jgi:hypothetical protein
MKGMYMGLTLQEPRVDVLMPTEPSKPTFRDIVREAVAAFGEKNAKTVTVIVDEVLKDTELTREVLANAARQAIREIGTREATRKAKEFGKTVKPSRGTAAIASAGEAFGAALLDTWKIGRKSFGDLLGKELPVWAKKFENEADGHIKVAKLMRQLEPLVPNRGKVRNSIDDLKFRAMWFAINRGK